MDTPGIKKKAYFLSDLHLGARYLADEKQAERRVTAFLESIRSDASEIYLLGDILDYWYEYRYVVPRGFVRFFGKLAELADSGIKITWMVGNHDIWIFDYLSRELGIEVIDGILVREILGKKFFMNHGDGVGWQSISFRLIRSVFRNRVCQKLFSGIHPRWTVPFALAWSDSSRGAGSGTDASGQGVKKLLEFSEQYHLRHPDINYFIFGHVHVMSEKVIAENCRFVTLGEWISLFSYAEYDGESLKLSRWGGQ